LANRHGLQHVLPVKSKKTKVRNRYFYYFVIRNKNKVLMKKRGGKDIWQGLYDFHLIETKRNTKTDALIRKDSLLKSCRPIGESKIYKHILSHQKLMVRFVEMQWPMALKVNSTELKWFTNRQTIGLPKPILIANCLAEKLK
jgi:A/G-specific adenine glycosylase